MVEYSFPTCTKSVRYMNVQSFIFGTNIDTVYCLINLLFVTLFRAKVILNYCNE